MLKKIQETSDFIRKQYATKPQVGIILGTGLGSLVNEIDIEHSIAYEDLPNFPVSTVESHKGRLIFGTLGTKQVVVMQGRFHTYEGYSMKEVTFPVRVMKNLGIGKLIVSNAAGGLNPSYELSDLMVLEDHIDLFSGNPLVGEHFEELGERFVDMSEPYSFEMIDKALEIAKKNDITVHKGVYTGVSGPNLETRAEYKYLRIIGGDAVGMSTIPEIIVARQAELPSFAISVITDLCYGNNIKKIDIQEILAAAAVAEPKLTLLIKELIS